jgi:hypothetical protein
MNRKFQEVRDCRRDAAPSLLDAPARAIASRAAAIARVATSLAPLARWATGCPRRRRTPGPRRRRGRARARIRSAATSR